MTLAFAMQEPEDREPVTTFVTKNRIQALLDRSTGSTPATATGAAWSVIVAEVVSADNIHVNLRRNVLGSLAVAQSFAISAATKLASYGCRAMAEVRSGDGALHFSCMRGAL